MLGAQEFKAAPSELGNNNFRCISYSVIHKLLEEVLKAAEKENMSLNCVERVKKKSEKPDSRITETTTNPPVLAALQSGTAQLAASTAWTWAREEFSEIVDVLFVDKAGQMSLADVLALSSGGKSLVLLGDPQQLEQPMQGIHPPGVAISALQHLIGDRETILKEDGLFLSQTWRLAPKICDFTSEVFYDNRLKHRPGLERQVITGPTGFAGAGLQFVPVEHEGNQSSAPEAVEIIAQIVNDLLQEGVSWTDIDGKSDALRREDILIVAPYNAQVFAIAERLPDVKVGTVDRFQGQEAPVVIYSMTTSRAKTRPAEWISSTTLTA